MKLPLAISPCPNDTYIFDALINQKIDTGGIETDVQLEDIQQLNERALQKAPGLIKVSAGVIPLIWNDYFIMPSGGAMGYGVGPLLITRPALQHVPLSNEHKVVLPGQHTTAHRLFSIKYPLVTNKQFTVFSSIEEDLLSGKADFGVIIHENRFTYTQKGLYLVEDLGQAWQVLTGLPIPLGILAARRDVPVETLRTFHRIVQQSIAHATATPALPEYVIKHAQEMNTVVMQKHIDLYVTSFSRDMGETGRKAIIQMLNFLAIAGGSAQPIPENLFLP